MIRPLLCLLLASLNLGAADQPAGRGFLMLGGITQLVDAGVVERREDPTDRRRSVVSVREGLRAESEALLEARLAPLRRVFDRFHKEQMDLVLEIFHALTEEVVHAARNESTPIPIEEPKNG